MALSFSSLRFFRAAFLGSVLLLGLTACASEPPGLPPEEPPETLYSAAQDLLAAGKKEKAAQKFEEVERQHPYSQWATRGALMAAYAYYEALDYEAATAALDQFIQLHPGYKDIAYAYYLRALCYYERIVDVKRDPGFSLHALSALQDVIARFPDSVYAKDAALKIALVNDHLAGTEMEIGRFYQRKKLYTAALGRFRTVIEKYQTTSHVPEALHRIVETCLALGMIDEAKATAAVLGYNFPGSSWYQDSYQLLVANKLAPEEKDDSWIARMWDHVF